MDASCSVRIPLINGGSTLVDAVDVPLVSAMRLHGRVSKSGARYVRHKNQVLARILLNAPIGMHVDHINGDTLDSRRCNLRICTHQQNQWNRKKCRGASNLKGVTLHKAGCAGRHWMARIEKDGHRRFLGYFTTDVEAARAYDAAAKVLFGEYAGLNFPTT